MLLFLAAVLGLLFPPLAVIILAMTIVGVFAKGVAADAQEQTVKARWKRRQRQGAKRPPEEILHVVPPEGMVIDVRWQPDMPPQQLPTVKSALER